MTYPTDPVLNEQAPSTAYEIVRRLAWPMLVFAGTLCAYVLSISGNVCTACPPKPISSALPWAVAGALFVMALQTMRDRKRETQE